MAFQPPRRMLALMRAAFSPLIWEGEALGGKAAIDTLGGRLKAGRGGEAGEEGRGG